jgi:GT2 family glycosyltransferase
MITRENRLISIIIVGYNSSEYLPACLNSIYGQSCKDFEVIFADNGSNDSTCLILNSYPELKIINNYSNKGFSFANNQAISIARGDYVLTLNSDVVLDKDFLLELTKAVKTNKAGLFGTKILSADGKTIDSTGLVLSSFYRFFDRGSGEIDSGQYDNEIEIFGPCAAAALYKREMLEDIKNKTEYFDEDFFFLAEDFDLAWRACNKKWKAVFVPSAICYHVRNGSKFDDKFRQYLSSRNRFFLLLKNDALNLKYFTVFLLYDIPRFIYMFFTNKYTLKALYEIIKYYPKISGKKR